MKLTLKHLARTLNKDPYKLRVELRQLYGKAKGARWQWANEQDKEYQKILRHFTGSRTPTTRSSSTPKVSSSRKEEGK